MEYGSSATRPLLNSNTPPLRSLMNPAAALLSAVLCVLAATAPAADEPFRPEAGKFPPPIYSDMRECPRTPSSASHYCYHFYQLQTVSPSESGMWRRGELNPCPDGFRRKLLHVYPVRDLGSARLGRQTARFRASTKFVSPSGAVAPPLGQPAVVAPAASRRRGGNVAVN